MYQNHLTDLVMQLYNYKNIKAVELRIYPLFKDVTKKNVNVKYVMISINKRN